MTNNNANNANNAINAINALAGTEIASDAARHGYSPRLIADNGEDGDQRVTLWECNGVMAIDTNGGATWEDNEGYEELYKESFGE